MTSHSPHEALSFSGCFVYLESDIPPRVTLLDGGEPPGVLFVCQDQAHRDKFLAAADRDLTGHLWHLSAIASEQHLPGRRRFLFTCEADIHAGILEARRVAGYPAVHPSRHGTCAATRGVRLPGPKRAGPPCE